MASQNVVPVNIPAFCVKITGVPAGGQRSEFIPIDAEACLGVTAGPVQRVGTEPVVVKMLDATTGQFRVPACTLQLRSEITSKTKFAPLNLPVQYQGSASAEGG